MHYLQHEMIDTEPCWQQKQSEARGEDTEKQKSAIKSHDAVTTTQ